MAVAAGTTPAGAAASTPVGGCWCTRTGSALRSSALRSAPDGADARRMCTAAVAAAPAPPPPPLPPPPSTSIAAEAINSPGSKREPVPNNFPYFINISFKSKSNIQCTDNIAPVLPYSIDWPFDCDLIGFLFVCFCLFSFFFFLHLRVACAI